MIALFAVSAVYIANADGFPTGECTYIIGAQPVYDNSWDPHIDPDPPLEPIYCKRQCPLGSNRCLIHRGM